MSVPPEIINTAALDARLKALEAQLVAKEHHTITWIKTNWVHYANFAGIFAALLKMFGKL